MTEEGYQELKTLAVEIVSGLVFTSDMIREADDLPKVFLPLSFLDEESKQALGDVSMFYEYYTEATGNLYRDTYDIFNSFEVLSRDHHETLRDIISDILRGKAPTRKV